MASGDVEGGGGLVVGGVEVVFLAGGDKDGGPEVGGELHLAALDGGQRNRNEGVIVVQATNNAVGAAGHGGVGGHAGEAVAEHRVGGVGGAGTNGVGGVDVLDRNVFLAGLEVLEDTVLEVLADVLLEDVAGSVATLFAFHELLAGAFGDDDNGVALAGGEAALEGREEAMLAVNGEGLLGDEAEVHNGVGEGGVSGDEARVAAHELDEADTIVGAKRLGVGGADGGNGGGHGGLKPEGAANEVEVVVDGLRNADDGNLQATAAALVGDVAGTTEGAIAANRKEDVDAHALKGVDHAGGVLLAAGGTEERAAPLVDGVDLVRRENHGLVAELGDEAGVAIAEAVNRLDAIAEGQNLDQALDDVVQARAEAAGGDDGGAGGAGIVENLTVGTGALKLGRGPILLDELLDVAGATYRPLPRSSCS